MTIRLLAAAESETGSVPPWRALVSACGGWEPYVRSYGGTIGQRTATEFVLLDRQFPRSVLRSLTVAENCLAELEAVGSTQASYYTTRTRAGTRHRPGGSSAGPGRAWITGPAPNWPPTGNTC